MISFGEFQGIVERATTQGLLTLQSIITKELQAREDRRREAMEALSGMNKKASVANTNN